LIQVNVSGLFDPRMIRRDPQQRAADFGDA
jgi:hypothetical protein